MHHSVRGDEVNYYFTITDSNDEPITGYTLTDEVPRGGEP